MLRKAAKVEKMTEVERQLQQRAQAEREMARKRQEMLYLKNKLQMEEKNTRVNFQKLNDSYKESLRLTQDLKLFEDMKVLKHSTDKRLDEIDFIIQKMVGELQEADRLTEEVQRSHLQHLERLCEQQKKVLTRLEQQRQNSLQVCSSKCSSEKDKMLADLQQQKHTLVDLELSNKISTMAMSENAEKFEEFIQEIHHQNNISTVLHLEDNKKHNQLALEQESPVLCSPREQDKLKKSRILERLQNEVNQLRQKGEAQKDEAQKDEAQSDGAQKDGANDQFKQMCTQLQDKLARNRQEVRKKLTDFSVQGATVTKKLQAAVTMGEKVLHTAECHNKLLRQQGVLPLSSGEGEHPRKRDEQEVWEPVELQELQLSLNRSHLQIKALVNHIKALKQENQQLQVMMDQQEGRLEGHPSPLPVLQVPFSSIPSTKDKPAHRCQYHSLNSCTPDTSNTGDQ